MKRYSLTFINTYPGHTLCDQGIITLFFNSVLPKDLKPVSHHKSCHHITDTYDSYDEFVIFHTQVSFYG